MESPTIAERPSQSQGLYPTFATKGVPLKIQSATERKNTAKKRRMKFSVQAPRCFTASVKNTEQVAQQQLPPSPAISPIYLKSYPPNSFLIGRLIHWVEVRLLTGS